MFQQLHNGSGYIPEMEQIISQLERGTLVTKFSWRVKSEMKKLAIRRETRELIWTRSTTGTSSNTSKPTFEGNTWLNQKFGCDTILPNFRYNRFGGNQRSPSGQKLAGL